MSINHSQDTQWETVIGLEVHAQVQAKSKLFSRAPTGFGASPNSQVALVDAALPGMLPVLNPFCVEQAIRTGLGLNAKINLQSSFERKNYFYPDLPQGYQISQFQQPIVGEGVLEIDLENGGSKTIRIERLHLEQDAGKSLHDQHPAFSFVDLNRSGVALMEIVSHPDLRSAAQAQSYVKTLRILLRYLDTCDGNMEAGSLRADVNVSVRKPGDVLGTRCEIKNVNSIRFIGQAIDYEAARQIAIIEDGGTIAQETRLFDPRTGETRTMRSKEEAHDYRYFPDPDLPPVIVAQSRVDELRAQLPELPAAKKQRFMDEYGLSSYDASLLIGEQNYANFFEQIAKGRDAKTAANMMIGSLFAALKRHDMRLIDAPIGVAHMGELLDLMGDATVSTNIAKSLFDMMFDEGADRGRMPRELVAAHGLEQVTDMGAIEAAVDAVMSAHPDKVEAARAKPKMAGWFVGQVMAATGGKAAPQTVNVLVRQKLGIDD